MAESIESFVRKLQDEGVEAGRQQAEQLKADAHADAEAVLADAQAQAERIIAEANAKAKQTQERARTELKLAARDAVLKLRDALSAALQVTLARQTGQALADEKFVTQVLHELIQTYAQADIETNTTVTLNVSPELRDKIVDWALDEIAQAAKAGGASVNLTGTLRAAGFEYNITGATVEVTVESVVAILNDLIAPRLAETLNEAIAETGQ